MLFYAYLILYDLEIGGDNAGLCLIIIIKILILFKVEYSALYCNSWGKVRQSVLQVFPLQLLER